MRLEWLQVCTRSRHLHQRCDTCDKFKCKLTNHKEAVVLLMASIRSNWIGFACSTPWLYLVSAAYRALVLCRMFCFTDTIGWPSSRYWVGKLSLLNLWNNIPIKLKLMYFTYPVNFQIVGPTQLPQTTKFQVSVISGFPLNRKINTSQWPAVAKTQQV